MDGPVREEWRKLLECKGARVVGYIPNYAYIVKMDKFVLEEVQSLEFVRWVGIYQPYYRVHPDLWSIAGDTRVKVLVFGNENLERTVGIFKKLGIEVISSQTGKSFHTIDAVVSKDSLGTVARIPTVSWIEKWYPVRIQNSISAGVIQSGTSGNTPIWNRGLYGDGQIVGESDTGIDWDHEAFRDPSHYQIRYSNPPGSQPPDLQHRKIVNYHVYVDDYDLDYSGHGTHVACTIAGNNSYVGGTNANGKGMAPSAKISFTDIGGAGDSLSLPSDLNTLYQWAYNDGARLHSNSWGDENNDYGVYAMQTDEFMWEHRDMLIFFAAGNSGPSANTVGNPGTAKNIVTVGATTHDGSSVADFSSRGPTADGRRKPTICAPGSGINSADSDGRKNSNNSAYTSMDGTSMATPTAAGGAALVRQYYTEGWYPTGTKIPSNAIIPSASLIKATLIAGARKMTTNIPDNNQGWGIINLEDSLYFAGEPKKLRIVDNTNGISTGQSADYLYYVSAPIPLRFVLVWTDYPGNPSAAKDIVNDLDLVVISPTNTTYLGNVFSNSESVSGGTADTTNVEECVYLNSPPTGLWIVRVIGKNVPYGPQPFSLVITGGIDETRGEIGFDRSVYKENDTITITVQDMDASTTTLSVMINSTTEKNPETVILTETAPGSKKFVGTINTSLTNAPGVLQISHGDDIFAAYADPSVPGWYAIAHAVADTLPPRIFNVSVKAITATSAVIEWDTDESADSMIKYGPSSPTTPVSDPTTAVHHTIKLLGLEPETTYVFDVYSTDISGHVAVADNNGSHFTFTTRRGNILLVDDDSGVNLDQYYSNAIESKGWLFGYWEFKSQGVPNIYAMGNFKAIVWHTSECYPQLGQNETNILKAYMDLGGNVFVSGQDIGWDIFENGGTASQQSFYTNYLHATYNRDVPTDSPIVLPTQSHIYGQSGDPISDAYTAGLQIKDNMNYGFYPDDITNNGGSVTFQQDTFNYFGQVSGKTDAGIRYEGNYRMVYFSFAFEDIQDANARADIMDKVLMFLTGTTHPSVTVISPNGGENVSGTVTITWNAAGATTVDLFYSPDNGITWIEIARNLPAAQGSYDWVTWGLEDGNQYRIGIYAVDAQNISAFDMSDGCFILANSYADPVKPEIEHTPITSWLAGRSIKIDAVITDNKGVKEARVYYKKTSEPTYTSILMSNVSSNYTATIPASAVTLEGLSYYIEAKDICNNLNSTPVYNVAVYEKSLSVKIEAFPDTIRPSGTSNLSITVTESGTPVENAEVVLGVTTGTLEPQTGMTNSTGEFAAVYTAPLVDAETLVRITVVAAKQGYANGTAQLEIKVVLPPLYANATLAPDALSPNETAELRILVSDENSQPVDGATVQIASSNGLSVNQSSGYTSAGLFATNVVAPYVTAVTECRIEIHVTKSGYTQVWLNLTVNVYPEQVTLNVTIRVPRESIRCYETLDVEIVVSVGDAPVKGANLTITTTLGTAAPNSTKTNDNGVPMSPVVYSPAPVENVTTATITVLAEKAGYKKCTRSVNITVLPMQKLTVEIQANSTVEENNTLDIVAIVSADGEAVEEAEVTITVSDGTTTYFTKTEFTDAGGKVVVTFRAPSVSNNTTVTITAVATKTNFQDGNATRELLILNVEVEAPSAGLFGEIPVWLIAMIVVLIIVVVACGVAYAVRSRKPPQPQQIVQPQSYYQQPYYPPMPSSYPPQQPQNPMQKS
ncbi:MAG: S8 family serine peptidase [Thermoplasmata archaeon]